MPLQFRAPFAINPNAESQTQQGLDQLSRTFGMVSDDAIKNRAIRESEKRSQQMYELQQAADRRAQTQSDYDYKSQLPGDPMAVSPAYGSYGTTGIEGPQPTGMLRNGTTGPRPTVYGPQPEGTLDYGAGMEGPQPQGALPEGPSLIDRFNSWHSQQGQGQGSGAPMDDYARMLNTPGAKNRSEIMNIMSERRKMAGQDADTNLKNAQAKWYTDRYKGPPGSVLRGGGRGGSDPSTMTTANLNALRNQISNEMLYAVPNSEAYNNSQEYLSMLDEELQNRIVRNKTPRVGGPRPGSAIPGNTPPSQENAQIVAWIQQNHPEVKNPSSADIAWAKRKMSANRR